MEGMSGIGFLETASKKPLVIITTAFEKYALKGYELQVLDYLLKPYPFERFFKAAELAHDRLHVSPAEREFFFVKTENRSEKVMYADVLHIEGMSDYRCIHTLKGKIMTLQTFSELEVLCSAERICRVHKSFMVALSKIEYVSRGRIRIGDEMIPISERYREAVFRLLNIS
jgi:DNA-binding LytR/AlgR family response regulator